MPRRIVRSLLGGSSLIPQLLGCQREMTDRDLGTEQAIVGGEKAPEPSPVGALMGKDNSRCTAVLFEK